jgi:hypothetical protein
MDKIDKFTIAWMMFLIASFTFIFSGCNVEKKAQKKFDKAYKASPKIVQQNLSKLFPPKPPVIKQGKTIYIQRLDSIKYYKNLADSLKKLPKQIITLQDSCGKEANESYNSGFDMGYSVGIFEGKSKCIPPTERTDTAYQPTPEQQVEMDNTKLKLSEAQKQAIIDKAVIAKQKDKIAFKNNLWLSFLSLFLLSVLGNVIQYKFKTKKLA